MGCGKSIEELIPPKWLAQFVALNITKSELTKLYKIFRSVDIDNSGSIDAAELLASLDVEDTPFTSRVFSIFDSNNSGKVDFREFVLALWNYCTLGNSTLDLFTFDLYDNDKSGQLSFSEVESIVKDIYGKKYNSNPNGKSMIAELKKIEREGNFNTKKFSEFAKSHQNMLFPAFNLQLHLQNKVLGRSFWERCSKKRYELSKGKYITMAELLDMHMDQDKEDKLKHQIKLKPEAEIVLNNTGNAHSREKPPKQKKHAQDTLPKKQIAVTDNDN